MPYVITVFLCLMGIFVIGLAVGYAFAAVSFENKAAGTLRVDTSDPDEPPYIFLEISDSMNDIFSKKYVVLMVDTRSYITQKKQ